MSIGGQDQSERAIGVAPLGCDADAALRGTLLDDAEHLGDLGQPWTYRPDREPAFIATLGMPTFEHLKANPEDAERFDRFMQHSPDDRHRAVAEAFPLASGARLVDVGGGNVP